MTAIALALAAGMLSTLSPCVLPLLPVVGASALQQHRHGPLALAAGLVVSSAAVGIGVASLGFTLGVDRAAARAVAAALLAGTGVVWLWPRLESAVATALAPVARVAGGRIGGQPPGLGGQAVLGLLLGAVWTPCTGPTLAAAVGLAARSESLGQAALVMLVFGAGTALPLLALAYGSRHALAARHGAFTLAVSLAKPVTGGVLLLVGGLTMIGADKAIEAWMVERMPDWLAALTTRL